MGEVWRARDTRLGRVVALKFLPEAFTEDPERLARFEREAQVLASLNHPNIAVVHGLEESGGNRALVMELVEGPTLAERLVSSGLSLRESLDITRQVVAALQEAHEKGIIHRDLKPQNVMFSKDGRVKVLDFGLAKLTPPAGAVEEGTTVAGPSTVPGVVLGTVGYMAPEQVRGEGVDERSDLFAVGCLLYEMLTGKRAFSRDTSIGTLNAILTEEPAILARPGVSIPSGVARVVQHCLEKNAARRYRSAHDLGFDLEGLVGDPGPASAGTARRSRVTLPWGIAALLAIVAGISIWRSQARTTPPPQVKRFVVPVMLPPPMADVGRPFGTAVALAPDGSRLAYVARDGADTRLEIRSLDELSARPLPGTRGASAPFFSPDGRWLGFFAERKLKKLDLVSGDVVALCAARFPWGGSWSGNEIFFTPGSAFGLWRVAAGSGQPTLIAAPEYDRGERIYRFPEALPGGRAVLFTWIGARSDSPALASKIGLLDLATGERRILIEDGSNARYASSGHIVYVRDQALLAVPFDLRRLEVTGPAVPLDIEVLTDPGTTAAQFALAGDGTLAYVPGDTPVAGQHLVWVSRNGEERPLNRTPRFYSNLSLSPDGRRLAAGIAEHRNMDIWVDDLSRGTSTRLTVDLAVDLIPTWTPSGERITFGSTRRGPTDIYWMPADGGEQEQLLVGRPEAQWPTGWSPDGRWLAYTESDPLTGFDIWMWSLEGKASPFLKTPFDEGAAGFSPDGKWLVYSSNESSRDEVYVRAFPGPTPKVQISIEGGTEPTWARSGKEIFYRNGSRMMAVAVEPSLAFRAEVPRVLFTGDYQVGDQASYAVTSDGERFVMIRAEPAKEPVQLHVALNWHEELKRRVPARR